MPNRNCRDGMYCKTVGCKFSHPVRTTIVKPQSDALPILFQSVTNKAESPQLETKVSKSNITPQDHGKRIEDEEAVLPSLNCVHSSQGSGVSQQNETKPQSQFQLQGDVESDNNQKTPMTVVPVETKKKSTTKTTVVENGKKITITTEVEFGKKKNIIKTVEEDGQTQTTMAEHDDNSIPLLPQKHSKDEIFPKPQDVCEKSIKRSRIKDLGNLTQTSFGVYQKQTKGEDRFLVETLDEHLFLFGVLDGHGNPEMIFSDDVEFSVVEYVLHSLAKVLKQSFCHFNWECKESEKLITKFITDAFVILDQQMHTKGYRYGTTCNIAIIDEQRQKIYHANLGDSRMIMIDGNFFNPNLDPENIVFESKDHDLDNPDERSRALQAGGQVCYQKHVMVPFCSMGLGVTRSFGDFTHKVFDGDRTYRGKDGVVCTIPEVSVIDYSQTTHATVVFMSDAFFNCRKPLKNNEIIRWLTLASSQTIQEIQSSQQKTQFEGWIKKNKAYLGAKGQSGFLTFVLHRVCGLLIEMSETSDDTTVAVVKLK